MLKYAWAQNRAKLERAIGELGPDATEEVLKARYIELAGLVLKDNGEVITNEPAPVEEEPVEAPKKTKKQK